MVLQEFRACVVFLGGVFLRGGVGGGGDSRLYAPKGEEREGRRLMVQ